MGWFTKSLDPEALRRQAAADLINGLEARLYQPPLNLAGYLARLDAGHSPATVIGDLAYALVALLNQARQYIAELEAQLSLREQSWQAALAECDRLRKEPLRQQLSQAQRRIGELTARSEYAETDLANLKRSLAAEQADRQQQVAKLQSYIAAQNRIIAQQQLRLNNLLGETPDAETPGQ